VTGGKPPPDGDHKGDPLKPVGLKPQPDPNDPDGVGECWWIETRMTWEGLLSPSLRYPIETSVAAWDFSKHSMFGLNFLQTKLTDDGQMDRIASLMGGIKTTFNYVHLESVGEVERRVLWTNSLLPPHHVYWHSAFDAVIGRALKGDFMRIRIADVDIQVSNQNIGSTSAYAGLGDFSGLGGF
jgi:hypothetical protein